MLNKVRNFVEEKKVKLVAMGATATTALAVATPGFCAEGDTATAMGTALTSVKTDALGALAVVAPIGIGIMGAFLVWKYGIRFFKSLAK